MFKYLPPDRIDVLTNNLLCFNNPLNFNDPFEFNVNFEFIGLAKNIYDGIQTFNINDYLSNSDIDTFNSFPQSIKNVFIKSIQLKAITELNKQQDFITNFATSTFNKFNALFINATRVLSLTQNPKNILMWGHYAQSHRGFVIEFNNEHSFFNQKRSEKDEYGFLRKVIYQKDLPSIDPNQEGQVTHFLTKSLDWKYEKEWRMLLPESSADKKIEFENKIFDLYYIPSDAIKNIILGCNCTNSFKDEIKEIVSSRKDFNHIRILHANRSTKKFDIDIY